MAEQFAVRAELSLDLALVRDLLPAFRFLQPPADHHGQQGRQAPIRNMTRQAVTVKPANWYWPRTPVSSSSTQSHTDEGRRHVADRRQCLQQAQRTSTRVVGHDFSHQGDPDGELATHAQSSQKSVDAKSQTRPKTNSGPYRASRAEW